MRDLLFTALFYLVFGLTFAAASMWSLFIHHNVIISLLFLAATLFCLAGLRGHLRRNKSNIRAYSNICKSEGRTLLMRIFNLLSKI